MEKDDEVIELLRYLPYTRSIEGELPNVAPWAKMINWQDVCSILAAGKHTSLAEDYRFLSEGEYQDAVPSSVIGLTDTGPDVECFLLDVEQGTIYWPECDSKIPLILRLQWLMTIRMITAKMSRRPSGGMGLAGLSQISLRLSRNNSES